MALLNAVENLTRVDDGKDFPATAQASGLPP